MRTITLLLAVLALAACDDDSAAPVAVDMAVAADMAMSTAPKTCNAALQCALACTTTQCLGGCGAALTGASQAKYNALGQCSNQCMTVDGGTGACNGVLDRSQACLMCAATLCANEEAACMGDQ